MRLKHIIILQNKAQMCVALSGSALQGLYVARICKRHTTNVR